MFLDSSDIMGQFFYFGMLGPLEVFLNALPVIRMNVEYSEALNDNGMIHTRFVLNVESLGNRPFPDKSRESWSRHEIFYNSCPSQGKVKENKLFSQRIIFISYLHGCSQRRCSNYCQ